MTGPHSSCESLHRASGPLHPARVSLYVTNSHQPQPHTLAQPRRSASRSLRECWRRAKLRSSRSAFPSIIELPGLSKLSADRRCEWASAAALSRCCGPCESGTAGSACEHRRSDGWTLLSALAPSKMNSRQTFGPSPRSISCRSAPARQQHSRSPLRPGRAGVVAVGVDCEGGDQHQVVFDLQAVDLAHHQVQLGQVRRLSASHSADCATNRREAADFEVPSLARRDVIAQRPSQSSNSGRDTQARGVAYWGALHSRV